MNEEQIAKRLQSDDPLTFEEYIEITRSTAKYPITSKADVSYLGLGLLGELGEVAQTYKRQIRDGTPVERDALEEEIGDVLWYWARMVDEDLVGMDDGAKPSRNKFEGTDTRLTPDKVATVIARAAFTPYAFFAEGVYYPPTLALAADMDPGRVALVNARKLRRRKITGTIKGSGGSRGQLVCGYCEEVIAAKDPAVELPDNLGGTFYIHRGCL